MSVFFHVDLDAFYASVEQVDNPELAGKPVIVGGCAGRRGVVSTCSYEARAFGVHSAMPGAEARRLCPQGIFVPVRMARYVEVSRMIMSIFGTYTPDVQQVSIDEASLDMTGTERLWGPPRDAARIIQRDVYETTGLTISIGIASNRYVAKIASGLEKPSGLVVVEPGSEAGFMASLPLDKLWGAGHKTRQLLARAGIHTIGQLSSTPGHILETVCGQGCAGFLSKAALGIDPGMYAADPSSRSFSTELTLEYSLGRREDIEPILLGMAEELIGRLYDDGSSSRCAVLKIRYDDFETVSMQETGPAPYVSSGQLYATAMRLFDAKWKGEAIRLIGLGVSGLQKGKGQGDLFDVNDRERNKNASIDQVARDAARRGLGTLTHARLVSVPPAKPRSRD